MCATNSRDIVVGRAEHDVLRRAELDDAAALHDGDVVADLQRLVEIVADEDDGLLQLAAAGRAARPAACRGSAGRAPRTARPSAGCRRRWRRRGRGRRAAACRRKARAAYLLGPVGQADERQLLVDDPVALGLPACRAARGRSRHSRAPSARAAARTAGTPWRRACVRSSRSVSASQRGDVDHAGPRARRATAPRVTVLRPLTARSSVDLPEPERPISTQISPALDGEVMRRPRRARCRSRRGSRRGVAPASSSAQRPASGRSPKTMSTLSNCDGAASALPSRLPRRVAGCLQHAVEHDGEDDDGEAGLEAHARC